MKRESGSSVEMIKSAGVLQKKAQGTGKDIARLHSIIDAITNRRRRERGIPFECDVLDFSGEEISGHIKNFRLLRKLWICKLATGDWALFSVRLQNNQPVFNVTGFGGDSEKLMQLIGRIHDNWPNAGIECRIKMDDPSCVYGCYQVLREAIALNDGMSQNPYLSRKNFMSRCCFFGFFERSFNKAVSIPAGRKFGI